MGHPKKRRKMYEKPRKRWELGRMGAEKELMGKYGLKNKREVWKATSVIKRYRKEIRNILAEIAGTKATEHALKRGESILNSLKRKGILKEGSGLEDALALSLEDILERRLQTVVHKKGMCNSLKHARQLIVHGHITVNGGRVTIPSYTVGKEEERKIGYYGHTPPEKEEIREEK